MENGRIEPLRALPVHGEAPVGQTLIFPNMKIPTNTKPCRLRFPSEKLLKAPEAPGGIWRPLEAPEDPCGGFKTPQNLQNIGGPLKGHGGPGGPPAVGGGN